jgi:hypothetical protein
VAIAQQGLGHHDAAIDRTNQAIALYRTLAGTEALLAEALETAAVSFEQIGDVPAVAERLTEAAALFDGLGSDRGETLRARVRALASRE